MPNPSPFLGVSYSVLEQSLSDPHYRQNIIVPTLQQIGAGMIRIEFKCNGHLPGGNTNDNTINFSGVYDPLIRDLTNAGIAVLALVDYLSTSLSVCTVNDPLQGPAGAQTNTYINSLASAARAIAQQYGAGSAVGHIAGIEVWNEPNSSSILFKKCGGQVRVQPDKYAALLTKTAAAVRGVAAPGQQPIPIMVGGLISEVNDPAKQPETYLSEVTPLLQPDAQGRWPWDIVAVHPYVGGSQVGTELQAVITTLTNLAPLGVPPARLWITEIGYSMCDASVTEQHQADELTMAIQQARSIGPAVQRLLWFTFHDFGAAPCNDRGEMMGLCTLKGDQTINRTRKAFDAYIKAL